MSPTLHWHIRDALPGASISCSIMIRSSLTPCHEFAPNRNALLQPEGFLQEKTEAKNVHSQHVRVARSLHRCRHPCCVQANSPSQLVPSAPSPQESTAISTIYRNTSDAAQAFLPSVQAVAGVVPGVGSIINGAIGGTLSVLQLVDVIRPHSRLLLR